MAVRALYWYNPAFWLMTSRAAQELESACDEAALAVLGPERRDEYAAALLRAAQQGQTPLMTSGFSMTGRQLRPLLPSLTDAPDSGKRRSLFFCSPSIEGRRPSANPSKEYAFLIFKQ